MLEKLPRLIALDNGSTLGIASNFEIDIPPYYHNQGFSEGVQALRTPVTPDTELNVFFSSICIARSQSDKNASLSPICAKGSKPDERFFAYREILLKVILDRYLKIRNSEGYHKPFILFEKVDFIRSRFQAQYNYGYLAHLGEFCYRHDFGIDNIHAATLKAWILKGHKGARTKEMAHIRMRERFSEEIRNDHEAHAIALLLCYIEKILNQSEKRKQKKFCNIPHFT